MVFTVRTVEDFSQDRGDWCVWGVTPPSLWVKPYTRQTQRSARISPDAKKYQKSKEEVALHIQGALLRHPLWGPRTRRRALGTPILDEPYHLTIAVFYPPVMSKSSPNYGNLPSGGKGNGDFDNIVKTINDAMKTAGITEDDSAPFYRGPDLVVIGDPPIRPGVHLGDWSLRLARVHWMLTPGATIASLERRAGRPPRA